MKLEWREINDSSFQATIRLEKRTPSTTKMTIFAEIKKKILKYIVKIVLKKKNKRTKR